MELGNIQKRLFEKSASSGPNSRRAELIGEITDLVNRDRGGKYKPLSHKAIAVKVGHLKEHDLEYMLSVGKDYMNRGNSFGKYFFGVLKTS